MLSMTSYGAEYPSGQLVSAVPLPSFSCTPSPLAGGVGWEAEEALTLCEHCSARTKTSLRYQRCFQHKSKTQRHTSYYEENYLSQTQHILKTGTWMLMTIHKAVSTFKINWDLHGIMYRLWRVFTQTSGYAA